MRTPTSSQKADDAVLKTLREHKKGLDVFEISSRSKCDLRDLRPTLDKLQTQRKVVSGLKKEEGQPAVFRRLYFLL